MAFRNRPAAKTVAKPAPKPTPAPARKPAPPAAKAPAVRPAPPAPLVEEQEEEFFEPEQEAQEEYVEGGQEEHGEEEQPEERPAPRSTGIDRPASTRANSRPSFSGSNQSRTARNPEDRIRLTGIWETKGSADILRGGLKDLEEITEWLVRAKAARKKVQVLTYRNNVNKESDPPFTVYLQIDNYVPGQYSGGGNRGGWGRGRSGGNYNRGGGDSRDRF